MVAHDVVAQEVSRGTFTAAMKRAGVRASGDDIRGLFNALDSDGVNDAAARMTTTECATSPCLAMTGSGTLQMGELFDALQKKIGCERRCSGLHARRSSGLQSSVTASLDSDSAVLASLGEESERCVPTSTAAEPDKGNAAQMTTQGTTGPVSQLPDLHWHCLLYTSPSPRDS